MRVPATVSELKTLITSLEHRERVCFLASKPLQNAHPEVYSIEVYMTELFDVKGSPKNVNIKAVDAYGKLVEINNRALLNKSKYLRLFHEQFWTEIHNILDKGQIINENQKLETKQNQIETKQLRIR